MIDFSIYSMVMAGFVDAQYAGGFHREAGQMRPVNSGKLLVEDSIS